MEKRRPELGDWVRLLPTVYTYPKGSVGEIITDDHSSIPFKVRFANGGCLWLYEESVELVKPNPTKSTRELKVGDTVRIKSRAWFDEVGQRLFDTEGVLVYFNYEMSKYCDTVTTIKELLGRGRYRIDADGGYCTWTAEMFDRIEEVPHKLGLVAKIRSTLGIDPKPSIKGNIPLIKKNKLLTNIKLDGQ